MHKTLKVLSLPLAAATTLATLEIDGGSAYAATAPHSYMYNVSFDNITIDQVRGQNTNVPDFDVAKLLVMPSGSPSALMGGTDLFTANNGSKFNCGNGDCGTLKVANVEVRPGGSVRVGYDIENTSTASNSHPSAFSQIWDEVVSATVAVVFTIGSVAGFASCATIVGCGAGWFLGMVAVAAWATTLGLSVSGSGAGAVVSNNGDPSDDAVVAKPMDASSLLCVGSVSNGDLDVLDADTLYALTDNATQSAVFTVSNDGRINPNCGPLPHGTVGIRITRGEQTDFNEQSNAPPPVFHYVPLAGADPFAWNGTWLDGTVPSNSNLQVQVNTNAATDQVSGQAMSLGWMGPGLFAPPQILDLAGANPLQPTTHPIAATSSTPPLALAHHVFVDEFSKYSYLSETDDNRFVLPMQLLPAYNGELLYTPPPTTGGGNTGGGGGGYSGPGGGHIKPTVVKAMATTAVAPPQLADTIAMQNYITLQLVGAYDQYNHYWGNRLRYVRTDINGNVQVDAMLQAEQVIN